MAYVFQEFPKFLHAAGKPSVVIQNREAQDAMGEGWSETPVAPPIPNPAASGALDPAADKAVEDSKEPWLSRAADAGLTVDKRWSLPTLTAKVLEAEAAKRS